VLASPLVTQGFAGGWPGLALEGLVITVAVWAMWRNPRVRALAIGFGCVAIIANIIDIMNPGHPAFRALLVFNSAFFILTLVRVFQRTVGAQTVTEDSLYGAGSVYLLIGLTWSFAYYAAWGVSASAFATSGGGSLKAWPDFVYFSFTTLSTLGYGDILPIAPAVRSMVILEVIVGVFFVAVIISKLVSLYRFR
jgi:hypothetical protein